MTNSNNKNLSYTLLLPDNPDSWITHMSRNGIFNISFIPEEIKGKINSNNLREKEEAKNNIQNILKTNIDNAIKLSKSTQSKKNEDILILDSAMADSSKVLEQIITDQDFDSNAIKILLANPRSDFAIQRASLIHKALKGNSPEQIKVQSPIDAREKLRKSLEKLIDILTEKEDVKIAIREEYAMDFNNKTISESLNFINNSEKIFQNINIKVKLYNEPMAGPLYFFYDVLLQGRFNPKGSANIMPWLTIINDPNCNSDLYDLARDEFNSIWDDNKRSSPEFLDNEENKPIDIQQLIVTALIAKAHEKQCADIYSHMIDILQKDYSEIFNIINNSKVSNLTEDIIIDLVNRLNQLENTEFQGRVNSLSSILSSDG